MTKSHLDSRAILLLTVLCIFFGWQQIAIKFTLDGISPMMQAGLRSLCAVLLLCGWMRFKKDPIFRRDGVALWGVLAGLLFAAEFLFLYWSLEHTGAGRATVFLYTSPFVVALGAHLFVAGERLHRIQAIGLLCAFGGIVLAFFDAFGENSTLFGDLLALAGGIAWGATTVLIKATPLRFESAPRILLYQLLVSGLTLPLLSIGMGEPGIIKLDQQTVLAFLFQTVVIAFVCYLSWFWLMRQYPANRMAAFTFLTPLFAVITAALLLDESMSLSFIGALLLVAVGIYLVNKPKERVEETSSA